MKKPKDLQIDHHPSQEAMNKALLEFILEGIRLRRQRQQEEDVYRAIGYDRDNPSKKTIEY